MAAKLKRDLGVEPALVAGDNGEFTVWVGDRRVAGKRLLMLKPSPGAVVEAVRAAQNG